MQKSYVYGFVKTDGERKIYIGYKSPDGENLDVYFSSSTNEEFFKDRSLGLLQRVILFEGEDSTAKALEWFALDYANVNKNDLFYNKVNSAHKGDQSLLTKEMKMVVVDFIEGNGMGLDEEKNETVEQHAARIEALAQDVLAGKYDHLIKQRKTSEIMKIRKSQVRVFENAGRDRVQSIANRMNEDPQRAREIFKPASLVKEKNGEMIIDGISRTTAADMTAGWDEIPTITLDFKLFGKTNQERLVGYKVFGGYMNKEDFEVRTVNSDADIKSQWLSIINDMKLDLSKPMHREKAKQTCFIYYKKTVPSAKKRQGLWKSLITDFENIEIENLYKNKKLKIYTDTELSKYEFKHYGANDVATIVTTMSKYKECVGYIIRSMKNAKVKKGAIIMYHSTFKEIEKNKKGELVQDVIESIEWMNLQNDIVVDVLPTYSNETYVE